MHELGVSELEQAWAILWSPVITPAGPKAGICTSTSWKSRADGSAADVLLSEHTRTSRSASARATHTVNSAVGPCPRRSVCLFAECCA
jgi:hypothetical protein